MVLYQCLVHFFKLNYKHFFLLFQAKKACCGAIAILIVSTIILPVFNVALCLKSPSDAFHLLEPVLKKDRTEELACGPWERPSGLM